MDHVLTIHVDCARKGIHHGSCHMYPQWIVALYRSRWIVCTHPSGRIQLTEPSGSTTYDPLWISTQYRSRWIIPILVFYFLNLEYAPASSVGIFISNIKSEPLTPYISHIVTRRLGVIWSPPSWSFIASSRICKQGSHSIAGTGESVEVFGNLAYSSPLFTAKTI